MPEPAGEFDDYPEVTKETIKGIQGARRRCRDKMEIRPSKTSRSHFSPYAVNSRRIKDLAERSSLDYANELLEIDRTWLASSGME